MPPQSDDDLQELVERLRSENASLRARAEATPPGEDGTGGTDSGRWRRNSWGWTLLSTVLIVIGALLAPVSVVANWARNQLTDTNAFVATFGPLAKDPAVQAYVSDEVVTAIDDKIDIQQLTSNLVDGITDLGLGPRASEALKALEGPAVQAIQTLIRNTVEDFVASPQFASLWERVVSASHVQLIATMQGDPDAMVAIGTNGTISIQLGPVIESVKAALVERGISFAAGLPAIDKTIVVATADAATTAQTGYTLASTLGIWLPWVSLAFLAAGVIVARRRARALIWAAIALAISMLLSLAGIGIGRPIAVGALSPSVMPSDAARAVYDSVTAFLASSAVAVTVLAVTVAIVGWLAGPFRLPRRLRAAGGSLANTIRGSAERHRLTTGKVGEWLYRQRVLVRVLVAIGAAAIVLFVRPLSPALVVWTAVIAVVVIALLEVLQRPPAAAVAEQAAAEDRAVVD